MFALALIGCGVLTGTHHIEIKVSRQFDARDPKIEHVTITNIDQAGCQTYFDGNTKMQLPQSLKQTCSDMSFEPGLTHYSGICTFNCKLP